MSRPKQASGQAPPDRLDRSLIVLGLVMVVGTIMSVLDTTIVNVALDTLGRNFDAPLSTVQWIVTGYLLALASVIPLTGWAIDRFGGRAVWMASIALFVAGSALCGAAWNIESLIVFRVLQGLGGGMLMPTGMAVVTMAAGRHRTGRMMGIVGIPMLLGPVVGPILGGWLVEDVGWRWIFFVNLPVGALALVLAAWKVPAGRPADGPPAVLDVRGLLLLPPGCALIIYGLSTAAAEGGFGDPATLGWLAAGAALVVLFVLHSLQRGERALFDVRLFADRTFTTASAGLFLVGIALMGSLLLLPLYYQLVRGQGALGAGLLLAPQGLGAGLAMPAAGMLSDRIGPGRVVPVGLVLLLLGTLPFTQVTEDTSLWLLGVMLFVRGLGLSSTMMPIMSAALTTLRGPAVPRATPALNIIVQIAGSFGSALLAVILARRITAELPARPGGSDGSGGAVQFGEASEQVRAQVAPYLASAFGTTFWVAFGLTLAVLVPALLLPRRALTPDAPPQPAPQP